MPKSAPPQTVVTQASDRRHFLISQLEMHKAHTTGVKDKGARMGEQASGGRTERQNQRQPPWAEKLTNLVS